MRAKKKQISSTLNVTTTELAADFRELHAALNTFTKKRGAMTKTMSQQRGRGLSSALDRLNFGLTRFHLVLSTKQSHSNLRVQMHLLSPWAAQFDRLLSNVFRILNDRVAMLWRPKRSTDNETLLVEAFVLHQDIASCSCVLSNALGIYRCPSDETVQPSVVTNTLISKLMYCLRKLLPMLSVRVEAYASQRVKEFVMAMLSSSVVDQNMRMYVARAKDQSQLGHLRIIRKLNDNILSTVMASLLNSKCTSTSKKRLISAAVSCCCDSLLLHVLDRGFRFNERGVLILHCQLQELLTCAAKVKDALVIPSTSVIAQGQITWSRANAILQLLLVATAKGGQHAHAVTGQSVQRERGGQTKWVPESENLMLDSTAGKHASLLCNHDKFCGHNCTLDPLLAVVEREAWLSLGRSPRRCGCSPSRLTFHLLGAVFSTGRKSAVVSISPVLLTDSV